LSESEEIEEDTKLLEELEKAFSEFSSDEEGEDTEKEKQD